MRAKARKETAARAGRGRFDETKHKRGGPGNKGQFANQAGKGDDAPRKGRTKSTAAELRLKDSGVRSSDRIVVLSARSRRYRGFETVGAFIDNHPQGRAYALRALAADHAKGAIGFSAVGGAAAPAAVTAQATPLKTSGVTGADTIVLRSTRLRSYREGQTVGEFVDGHPKGKAFARRKLATDHGKGLIGFRGAPAGPAAAAAGEGGDGTPRRQAGWVGRAEPRDIAKDKLKVEPEVLKAGLFKDKADLRKATAALLAGVPKDERLQVSWTRNPFSETLELRADTILGANRVERRFRRGEGGGWEVEHTYFALPLQAQGGGNARRMLRASVEEYDRLGVGQINVHANIAVGAYAWAKLGFAARRPADVRAAMEAGIARDPRSPVALATRRILDTSDDDGLMHSLANAKASDGAPIGKAILGEDAKWYGRLDLSNDSHRARLGANFRG